MGNYTSKFRMYKPLSSEIVDVDQHLNYNWEILDLEVKRLMEYRYTNVVSVGDSFSSTRKPMHRWYKTWSNAILFQDFDNNLQQDPNASVTGWTSAKSMIRSDWGIKPDNGLYYRIIKGPSGSGSVEWTGSIIRDNEASITPYIEFQDVLTLTPEVTPKMSRYFIRTAGNADSGFSTARLIFNRFGHVDIIRYGDPVSSSGHRKIDFGSIRYDIDLEAT